MAHMRDRQAVVIGGTGFIGRHICRALTKRGYEVLAIARKPAEPIPGVAFLRLDAVSAPSDDIARAAKSADLVVNAAGDSWEGDEESMTASHIPLVDRLVDAVATLPRRPRLVHLGSVHEYGPVPDGTAIAEDHPTAPHTPYARTKLIGSRIVLGAADAGRVDGCVLRVTNVCGPGTPGAASSADSPTGCAGPPRTLRSPSPSSTTSATSSTSATSPRPWCWPRAAR
ncbi:hypothetical protein SSPO_015690 [Streptomyces antimycoticus]|uniref:NAD-dependent epimerase/dehydratase domain-containing protein n=1 Tax=Streptomyces antimycoticus TaxID=68175 RepID=A0A499UNY1_9ACTN|nr:NAD-dependent epimerase/dehydratase family protein [Streptomyces antimycoticus]BBJ38851.1 hypothetical protein SSPO_015690 [Streptomyces antimycoticus]